MPDTLPDNTMKVLIVEDDANVRLGCEQALELEDIRAQAVDSAEKARRLVAAGFPGVVVTDIRLPGMDGMDLLRHLLSIDMRDFRVGADNFQDFPQPHQEGRVGVRQSDAGNRHHFALTGSRRPTPQDGLPVAHQGVGFVDDEKAELFHRRGMPDALL